MARVPVIAYWDDDDWQAPDRLPLQLAALAQSGAAICVLAANAFLAVDGTQTWDYRYGDAIDPGPSRS
jgi:hypothetical protein